MSGHPWIAFRSGEWVRVVDGIGVVHFEGSVDNALVRFASEIESSIAYRARVKELEDAAADVRRLAEKSS